MHELQIAKTLKLHKNQLTFPITAVIFTTLLSLFTVNFLHPFTVNNSYADDNSVDASANVASNLSISANSVSMDTTPDVNGSWLTGTSTVDVSTNNVTGYTLYISSSTDELDLVNTSNSSYVIDNLESETTLSTFQSSSALMNHYGFTHDNNGDSTTIDTDAGEIATGTYLPLATITNPTKIKTTTSAANTSETVVTFATKVDRSIPAGEYTNTITFTAVGNAVPKTLKQAAAEAGITTMQGMTSDVCASAEIWQSTEEDFTLTDTRDNQAYSIRKLADGNCWMAANLNLNATSLTNNSHPLTLTSDDTDINPPTESFEMPNDTNAIPANVAPVGSRDGAPASGTVAIARGTYYAWCAATADCASSAQSSGEQRNSSICPKNWKLPYNDGSISATNVQWNLYDKYNSDIAKFLAAYNYYYSYGPDYYFAGTWDSEAAEYSVFGQGSWGEWLSNRSREGVYMAYTLEANSEGLNVQTAAVASYMSHSVRCVLPGS